MFSYELASSRVTRRRWPPRARAPGSASPAGSPGNDVVALRNVASGTLCVPCGLSQDGGNSNVIARAELCTRTPRPRSGAVRLVTFPRRRVSGRLQLVRHVPAAFRSARRDIGSIDGEHRSPSASGRRPGLVCAAGPVTATVFFNADDGRRPGTYRAPRLSRNQR